MQRLCSQDSNSAPAPGRPQLRTKSAFYVDENMMAAHGNPSPVDRHRPASATTHSPSSGVPHWRESVKHARRRPRFSVFSRDALVAKSEMLEVLGDILDSWGDECVEGLAKMRPEDIFRKARDVMTELAQLTRTQGVLIESLKGDIEGVRQELDATRKDKEVCIEKMDELEQAHKQAAEKLHEELSQERQAVATLEKVVADLTEQCQIMAMEQNETKHSLTTQLLQCQARIDEDNRIAKTILSRLVEKDSKIFALQGKLKKYTHTTQQMKEIEQESDFHFTLLCEAHRKIQEIIPVHDEILARARATVKATSDCLDDALAAEEAFQADAKVNVEDVIPSVRVKRQTVKP